MVTASQDLKVIEHFERTGGSGLAGRRMWNFILFVAWVEDSLMTLLVKNLEPECAKPNAVVS